VFEAAAAKLNYRQNVFLLLKVFFASTLSGLPVYSTPVNFNFKFLKLIRFFFVQFQLDSSFFFKIEAPSKFFFISTHFFSEGRNSCPSLLLAGSRRHWKTLN